MNPFISLVLNNLPLIFAALGGLVAVLIPLLFKALARPQQDQLLGAVKGAYVVLAAVAPSTSYSWDDAVAALLKKVEIEMGRNLKPKEVARVKGIALALLADPSKPDPVGHAERGNALRAATDIAKAA